MNDTKEIERIVNRHMARMLSNLEQAGCPVVFIDWIKSGLSWLRSDLVEALKESNEKELRMD